MKRFFGRFFDTNAKELARLQPLVEKVAALESQIQELTDEGLRQKTQEFKGRLSQGETLDDILVEAFAVVREASKRALGMRHFDVQVLGGIILHQGMIAEMKTGEGKTLAATLPVYLNALTGKGVHVVTVNDYLATRDSQWMGAIYRFLGLDVGVIVHGLDFEERRQAYAADVTYGTNNEFGFDYLRDNMVLRPEHMVQRGLNYAIVDEVDSILVDEARTPLIISGVGEQATDLYYQMAQLVPKLKAEEDYTMEEKARSVWLTEEGVARVEKMLAIDNLYDDQHINVNHALQQALKAKVLMKRDVDYMVKDGQIVIVDEFTGRAMPGRRYSEGLHQAIEAKEGVKIERESQTLASITFQNYFRMYQKLSGMTGTAATEAAEFRKIYGLDVLIVPTHRTMVRQDFADAVYKNLEGKVKAVVEEIAQRYQEGQPCLVGTVSIEKSELFSKLLKQKGIPHQVLNAKHHEKEAEIVAQAGRYKAVTIATNMAGRGTDITLGGNPEFMAKQDLRKQGYTPEEIAVASEVFFDETREDADDLREIRSHYHDLLKKYESELHEEKEKVLAAGGLHIIGTERHESRRIDNQLRGRSGRQGDPGSSRFYVSLEDDLMRLFGGDRMTGLMERLGWKDDTPIEHGQITKAIENAQKKVEANHFEMRKQVLQYDDVMNMQREVIYDQRRRVLLQSNLRESILDMVGKVVERTVVQFCDEKTYPEDWDLGGLGEVLQGFFGSDRVDRVLKETKVENREQLTNALTQLGTEVYQDRIEEMGTEVMADLERYVLLRMIDDKWIGHLRTMDDLRQGITWRAYGQMDPLVEYKRSAYDLFEEMKVAIQEDALRMLFRVEVRQGPPQMSDREERLEQARTNRDEATGPQIRRTSDKIGRNDTCPCGSGKKFKKCCGRE